MGRPATRTREGLATQEARAALHDVHQGAEDLLRLRLVVAQKAGHEDLSGGEVLGGGRELRGGQGGQGWCTGHGQCGGAAAGDGAAGWWRGTGPACGWLPLSLILSPPSPPSPPLLLFPPTPDSLLLLSSTTTPSPPSPTTSTARTIGGTRYMMGGLPLGRMHPQAGPLACGRECGPWLLHRPRQGGTIAV